MRYRQLEKQLQKALPQPDYAVDWFVEGHVSEADYTIVPLPDGRFTLFRPTGRGDYHPDFDNDGHQRFFATEDEVCEFVWIQATRPRPEPTAPLPELEDEAAAQRASVLRSLGLTQDPYQ